MFYDDHFPPHFHATYGENEIVVGLAPITILAGQGPARVRSMVLEWTALHLGELLENWDSCRAGVPPRTIAPLD